MQTQLVSNFQSWYCKRKVFQNCAFSKACRVDNSYVENWSAIIQHEVPISQSFVFSSLLSWSATISISKFQGGHSLRIASWFITLYLDNMWPLKGSTYLVWLGNLVNNNTCFCWFYSVRPKFWGFSKRVRDIEGEFFKDVTIFAIFSIVDI